MWEVEVLIVAIDLIEVFNCWRTENLDDLNELVGSCCSREYWLPEQQLSENTTSRPDVYRQHIFSNQSCNCNLNMYLFAYITNVQVTGGIGSTN